PAAGELATTFLNGTVESHADPGAAADATPAIKESGAVTSTAMAAAWSVFMSPPAPGGGPAPRAPTPTAPACPYHREQHNSGSVESSRTPHFLRWFVLPARPADPTKPDPQTSARISCVTLPIRSPAPSR